MWNTYITPYNLIPPICLLHSPPLEWHTGVQYWSKKVERGRGWHRWWDWSWWSQVMFQMYWLLYCMGLVCRIQGNNKNIEPGAHSRYRFCHGGICEGGGGGKWNMRGKWTRHALGCALKLAFLMAMVVVTSRACLGHVSSILGTLIWLVLSKIGGRICYTWHQKGSRCE